MTDTNTPTQGINKLYFAAWRWHFYAGLYVIPFLLMLAITGFFMLILSTYWPETGDRLTVTPTAQSLSVTDQIKAALAAVPDATKVSEYITPYSAETVARVTVTGGVQDMVLAINPYTGEVLRQTPDGSTWYLWFEKIHGDLLIGKTGDILIEIAAGLGLLMVVTGLYLVWPRRAGWAAMFIPNLAANGRAWWKSLHQVIGTWTSLLLAGFFITGMAWASIWGEMYVQAWSTFPAEKWDNVPLSDQTHISLNGAGEKQVPWALEQTPLPLSGSAAGVQILPEGTVLDYAAMEDLGRKIGFEGRFHIATPSDETGVWTLSQDTMSYDGKSPTIDRTVHIDQFTGKVLADVRYSDYSLGAKAMAVGLSLHEGQIGLWNFLLNMVFLGLVVFSCISGLVMWWKRRPDALRLGAPPMPSEMGLWKGAAVIAVLLSLGFPLIGAVLVGVLALDILVIQNVAALKRVLS